MESLYEYHTYIVDKIKEWCNMNNTFLVHIWIGLFMLFMINVFLYIIFSLFGSCRAECRENCPNYSARLLEAFEAGSSCTIMGLINAQPELINKPLKNGFTPFMMACSKCHTQLVKFMLSKGADIHKKTPQNESVFYLAVFYLVLHPEETNATCIRELFYAGCDVNEPNCKGYTPLQMAAMFGHISLVRWLLHKTAKVNVIPHPAVIATSQGYQETACLITEWEKNMVKAVCPP